MFAPTHLKIFLASPSDVKDDREMAVRVLKRIAETAAFNGRVTLEVFTYDDANAPTAMPVNVNPQMGIVEYGGRPSEYDFTIIILWSRMGTRLPPSMQKPGGGTYESGTEWEYEDARRAGKDVFVYLKADQPPAETTATPDAQEQQQKLKRFVKAFRNADGSLEGFVNEYRTRPGLESILDKHMQGVVRRFVDRAEKKRNRIRLGALASLVLVAAALFVVSRVQARKADEPKVTFNHASDCVFVPDQRTGFLKVDYKVANARDTHTVNLILDSDKSPSHPIAKRSLTSQLAERLRVDFRIKDDGISANVARIEVEGPDTKVVSRDIPVECSVVHP